MVGGGESVFRFAPSLCLVDIGGELPGLEVGGAERRGELGPVGVTEVSQCFWERGGDLDVRVGVGKLVVVGVAQKFRVELAVVVTGNGIKVYLLRGVGGPVEEEAAVVEGRK